METPAYCAATYIGRRGPVERRRPPIERDWWVVESRMLTGRLRANNAIASFHNATACSIAKADSPSVARFLKSDHAI